jgi:hypothetical protein
VNATRRQKVPQDPTLYAIKAEFKPQPGEVVITKQRASAFYGTPLMAHLTQLGIQTIIICGESTSGCVRASSVDAYSNGFHVVVVEECCFDRSVGILAARAGVGLVELSDRLGAALIGQFVEVDRQECGRGAHKHAALIVCIDIENVGWHDIAPAMIFELVGHQSLHWLDRIYRRRRGA